MNQTGKVTKDDLEWWLDLAPTLDWVFAVTYAKSAPHEYVANGRTEGLAHEDFVRAARVIRTFGEPAKFYNSTNVYLSSPDGWKWWGMSANDVTASDLINRAHVEHVYGAQNAPRTRTEYPSPYDQIATFWDHENSATAEERAELNEIVLALTGGRRPRMLDVGCGTGLALDLDLTDPVRYVGIDSSRGMLNELVLKYPELAGIHPMPLSEAFSRHVLGGTRFDLVVALGGSASYLSAADLKALERHSHGPMVLTVYAEGHTPAVADLAEAAAATSRQSLRDFATIAGGSIRQVGRFEVAITKSAV